MYIRDDDDYGDMTVEQVTVFTTALCGPSHLTLTLISLFHHM